MGKRQSRWVGPLGDDHGGRSVRAWFTIDVFRILTVLGLGLVLFDRARAQDPTPKADAPRESAPAAGTSEALSVRYQFTEKYSRTDEPQKPELVSQYQVALRGTYKTETEKSQGAADRSETSSLMRYTERPAKVSKVGEVTDAVRRYDRFRMSSTPPIAQPKLPWFEGLTIWYHRRPGLEPEILSLTDGRRLRELEFGQITQQVFLPQLTAIFPPTPIRVGDTWHIPLNAARNLLGDTPDPEDYTLDGTLIEVRKGTLVTELIAVLGISGQFTMSDRQCAVGARIDFNFEPQAIVPASPRTADGAAKAGEKIVYAKGWVSRLLMTQQAAIPIPESDGRLKQTTTFELNLERRRQPTTASAAPGARDAPLTVPEPAPTADEDNSWLVYEDPQRQFRFRCPQEMRLETKVMDPNVVELVGRHAHESALIFQFLPKETDPERERQSRDPDYRRRELYAMWEKQEREIVKGPAGWLPEADWLPEKKVYRIEAATQPPGAGANAPRLYCDYYVVIFQTIDKAMVVQAFTPADHLKFRDQAEAVIKSFQFGPSEDPPKSPAATPTTAPKPPL